MNRLPNINFDPDLVAVANVTRHGIFPPRATRSDPGKGRTIKRTIRTQEQIIGILQEHEARAKCADVYRKHRIVEGTFYAWKAKYSGMTASEVKRLKALEDENVKPKRPDAQGRVSRTSVD